MKDSHFLHKRSSWKHNYSLVKCHTKSNRTWWDSSLMWIYRRENDKREFITLIVVEWLKIFNVFVFKFSLNWYMHESTVNPWKMISLWWINDFCNKIWSFLQLDWTKVSEEWYPYLQLEKRTDPGVIFKCSKYFWYAPGQTANVKMPRMEKNMLTIPNTIPPLRKSKQQQHRDVFRQSSNVNMANWKWKKGRRVSISLLYRINQQQSKQPIIKHIHNAFTPNAGSTNLIKWQIHRF